MGERKKDEIEITPQMIQAGALVIETYADGDHYPAFVAEQVFRAMLDCRELEEEK